MLVLGLETTCDETAAALIRRDDDGSCTILANRVYAQGTLHAPYGGVVPELAARCHVDRLDQVVADTMAEAGKGFADLDGIAVSAGPGLMGGLLVGLTMAKAIAMAHGLALLPINHLEAHALTARMGSLIAFPYLLLLISGGHTQLVYIHDIGHYRLLGTTVDDALGEGFDKVARILGLPYPGGPSVERAALEGNAGRFALPRPMAGRKGCDFSFSGLKTAVSRIVEITGEAWDGQCVADLCASFQSAVVDVLRDRVSHAIEMIRAQEDPVPPCGSGDRVKTLVCAGGVAANMQLREALTRLCSEKGLRCIVPAPELCTDNGAMVAWAGAERLARGMQMSRQQWLSAVPRPRWSLGDSGEAGDHSRMCEPAT